MTLSWKTSLEKKASTHNWILNHNWRPISILSCGPDDQDGRMWICDRCAMRQISKTGAYPSVSAYSCDEWVIRVIHRELT